MASEYTPNYNLDKYVGTDKPNLRDQYNSAMDKIDAQFVVIENDRTNTNNQISAINTNMTQLGERVTAAEDKVTAVEGQISATNTNMTQLGERVTAAEDKVTAVEGQISATNTELAKVKSTADNAMSLASTNDAEMTQVQQGVTNLQSVTRSLVLHDSANKPSASQLILGGIASQWESSEEYTLEAAVPDWANFLDVTVTTNDSYWREGASSFRDSETFMAPVSVLTFPLNEYYVEGGTVKTRRASKFSLYADTMKTNGNGMMSFGSSHVPFIINGTTLTQKGMGLAKPASLANSAAPYTNGVLGCMYTYAPNNNTPTLSNIGSSFVIVKIVARA